MIFVLKFVSLLLLTHEAGAEVSLMNGDVIINGLFDIYDSNNGRCSSDISPSSVKNYEAIKWTLRMINSNNYVPGIKIGIQAWPTCGLVSEANDKAIDFINKVHSDKMDTSYQSPPVIGIIGPGHSSEAGSISVLLSSQRPTDRLIQIGYSTTASSLSNTNIYPNFYRVVPNDEIQVEVMVSLLKKLEWNYIVVIYDMDNYGKEGYESLKTRVKNENICIKSSFGIPIDENGAVTSSSLRTFLDDTAQLSVTGAVVFSTAVHIKILLNAASLRLAETSDQISFLFSEGIDLTRSSVRDNNDNVYEPAKGAYVTAPPRSYVNEFESYWKNMFKNISRLVEESETNSWLKNVFSFYSDNNCFPSNESANPGCNELTQSEIDKIGENNLYTSYAIESASLLAKLLKDVHTVKCSGSDGFCESMKSVIYNEKGFILDKIKDISVDLKKEMPFLPEVLENKTLSFATTADVISDTQYNVYNTRKCLTDDSKFCFVEIGKYLNSSLTLDTSLVRDYHKSSIGKTWPNINRAQCLAGQKCSVCILDDLTKEVLYEDGDIIVAGIIPIYNKDNGDPLGCNGIRTTLSVEIAEAMEFAVKEVNRRIGKYQNIFPGEKIGYAFINSCNQPLVVQSKILELLQKGVLQKDGTFTPISHKLVGWIGAYGSSISLAASQILSKFGYIQIAYASTAAVLSDRNEHPYFMRTCTPDDKQAKAMIKIIQTMQSNYIQVVYSEGTYGEGGRDAIRKEAQLAKICIRNEIVVMEGEVYYQILNKLRENPSAKIVIMFLRSHVVDLVTSAINEKMDYGEFMFIGSEAWGYRPDQFQEKKKLVGSITLALRMAENENFTSYLGDLNVYTNTHDPWLREYTEKKFDCYFNTSFDKTSENPCNENLRLTDAPSFKQEIWTPFALNAMLVLLSGTSDAFNDLCGSGSPSLCDQFRLKPDTVRNRVLQQTFDIANDGNEIRMFDDNGDGNVGYRIYNIQRSPLDTNVLLYEQVGQSPLDEANFKLETETLVKPDGMVLPAVCPNTKACSECFPNENNTPNDVREISVDSNKTVTTVLGAFVGVLTLAVTILVGCILMMKRNRYPDDDTYLDATDPYLTPSDTNRDGNNGYQRSTDSPNNSADSGITVRDTNI
ncbi:uncharacterized protein LOC143063697 [Mytilus galloprovincialis]|uniref:uncharacterized protein LOC143063697 n=1 Tax=Mytilus galloprovincialis TaxID=29158 RepID=UPI003F7BCE66